MSSPETIIDEYWGEDGLGEERVLLEEALDHFRLLEHPFSTTPNPRFLYHTENHLNAFSKCRQNIVQRQGLSVICGDVGTGKSTVARRLFLELKTGKHKDRYDTRLIKNAGNWTTTSKMIRALSNEFGCNLKRSEDLQWAEFEQFAVRRATMEDVDTVLIVDEAQEIPRRILIRMRELLNLETDTRKILQIVLFSTLDLADKFREDKALRPLRSRIAGGMSFLTPLDLADLTNAIKYRLMVAGRTDPVFEEEAFDVIHAASQGVLRDAIDICRAALIVVAQEPEEDREDRISAVTTHMAVNYVQGVDHSRSTVEKAIATADA